MRLAVLNLEFVERTPAAKKRNTVERGGEGTVPSVGGERIVAEANWITYPCISVECCAREQGSSYDCGDGRGGHGLAMWPNVEDEP